MKRYLPPLDGRRRRREITDDCARFLVAATLFLLMDAIMNPHRGGGRTAAEERKRIARLMKDNREYTANYSKRIKATA
jgi:hypothetical protein